MPLPLSPKLRLLNQNTRLLIKPSNETIVSQSAEGSQAHKVASNKSSLYNPDSPQSSWEPRQELASFLDKQFRRKMSYDQVYEILDNCNIPWVYCLITPTLDPSD